MLNHINKRIDICVYLKKKKWNYTRRQATFVVSQQHPSVPPVSSCLLIFAVAYFCLVDGAGFLLLRRSDDPVISYTPQRLLAIHPKKTRNCWAIKILDNLLWQFCAFPIHLCATNQEEREDARYGFLRMQNEPTAGWTSPFRVVKNILSSSLCLITKAGW